MGNIRRVPQPQTTMTARQLFSRSTRFALAGTSATAFCIATAYTTVALAESPANAPAAPIKRTSTPRDQSKATFAWGKTRHSLAAIQDDVTDQIKKPTPVPALDGVVLRDLAFHDQYAGEPFHHFNR